MAFRKDTIKQQFAETLPSVLEPGEKPGVGLLAVSAPARG